MSKQRLVDTNLIVRYLVQDHDKHAREDGTEAWGTVVRRFITRLELPITLTQASEGHSERNSCMISTRACPEQSKQRLFVSQSIHRLNSRSPHRRNPSRKQRDPKQHHRRSHK